MFMGIDYVFKEILVEVEFRQELEMFYLFVCEEEIDLLDLELVRVMLLIEFIIV